MSTTREVRVIKATKGNDVANKIRVAAYCRVSSDSQDQANFLHKLNTTTIISEQTRICGLWIFMPMKE